MTPEQVVEIFGFFLGTLLHVWLAHLVLVRRARERGETALLLLVVSMGLWNLGNFVSAFAATLLEESRLAPKLPWLEMASSLISIAGLCLIPSLLLNCLGGLYLEKQLERLRSRAVVLVFQKAAFLLYLPCLGFPLAAADLFSSPGTPASESLAPYLKPFTGWFVGALLIGALLTFRIRTGLTERRARRLFSTITLVLLLTALLVGVIFFFGRSDPKAQTLEGHRFYLEIFIVLASILPSMAMAYNLYRYYAVELLLQRGFLYLLLALVVVLVYLWGISTLSSYLKRSHGLNKRLIEGLLIMGLALLFHPFRQKLQEKIRRFFFRDRNNYRRVFAELTDAMGRGSLLRLPELLDHVVRTVEQILEIDGMTVVLFGPEGEIRDWAGRRPHTECGALRRLLASRGNRPLPQNEITAEDAVSEASILGASIIIPMRRENALAGFLALGPKREGGPLREEEKTLLALLAKELAISAEHLRLLEERITLEREIERTEKLAALGRLSGSVAHRIKNPLSSIKAIVQTMREELPAGNAHRDDLAVVVEEIDRLDGTIRQLLSFARPAEARKEPVPLQDILKEVNLLFGQEAANLGIRIIVEGPSGPFPVRASRAGLREIFSNLIQNGLHAMEERGGVLKIRLGLVPEIPAAIRAEKFRADSAGPWIMAEVSDEGAGIPVENLAMIFKPFFTTKQKGTGLGLTIVKRKVDELGGRIEVAIQKGTTFTLFFPAASGDLGGVAATRGGEIAPEPQEGEETPPAER
jgi:signal transduction histidine kinase